MNHKHRLSNLFENEDQLSLDEAPSFHHFTLQSSPMLPQSPESLWSHSPSYTPYSHSSPLCSCISSFHHKGQVYCIAVCGDLVLTGSSSRKIRVWHSSSHGLLEKGYIQSSSSDVRAMLAQGNINMLFTSHKDHKIRVWNIKNYNNYNNFRPKKITTLPNLSNFVSFRPIITPQHRLITSKTIGLQHKDIISCMGFYHAEGLLYTGSYDKTIKAWRLSERKCIDSFIAHSDKINDMVINQQNGNLFTCSSDGTVKLWLRIYGEFSHTLIKVICFHANPIYALALSISPPSQNQTGYLYFGSFEGSLNFAELETISCEYNHGNRIVKGHQFAVLCLVALENFVISGSEDSTIRVWRRSSEERGMESHECVAVLEGHRGPVRCLGARLQKESFHAMSLLVFSASLDQTFKVWRVQLELQEINIYSPNRRSNANDYSMEGGRNSLEFEGSPVLSPAWVKKKLQDPSIH